MFSEYPPSAFAPNFFVLLQHGVVEADSVLAPIVPEQLQRRACVHHIRVRDGRLLRDIINAHVVRRLEQQLHNHLGPVRAVGEQAEITEWLLGAAELALLLAELVRELDEQLAIAKALVLRERKDTGDIVVLRRFFLFRKVADDVTTGGISLGHDIIHKRSYIVVQCFMIQKAFR